MLEIAFLLNGLSVIVLLTLPAHSQTPYKRLITWLYLYLSPAHLLMCGWPQNKFFKVLNWVLWLFSSQYTSPSAFMYWAVSYRNPKHRLPTSNLVFFLGLRPLPPRTPYNPHCSSYTRIYVCASDMFPFGKIFQYWDARESES